MKKDIVYILKNDIQPDELRYSLRSVCDNFPHRSIVFVGGCPNGLRPDIYIPHEQTGKTKWEKATSSMIKAFSDDRLTDEIFLFNDDFFVLNSIDTENYINFTDGTLDRRVQELEANLCGPSKYSQRLKNTCQVLRKNGHDTLSFALHLPMLIDRHKALDMLEHLPGCTMFRSMYGNIFRVPYVYHKDVKIFTNDKMPESDDFLSTDDVSFREGLVGEYIRSRFADPCRCELNIIHELYTEEGDDRYYTEPVIEKGEKHE